MEFIAFPKLHRLMRGEWVVSEKLDGTNACVQVTLAGELLPENYSYSTAHGAAGWVAENNPQFAHVEVDNVYYVVAAQSRKRMITPEDDNYGFARWVYDNAEGLARALGPGAHFGEWWGQGVQRRYGMDRKLFSLFNTGRWSEDLAVHEDKTEVSGLRVVPVLATIQAHDAEAFEEVTDRLRMTGSIAAPGFMDPEGVVVFDTGNRTMGKWTFKGDEPKWTKSS